jgi:glycosyltransferase involved in cell wall biosynthesis
MACGTPVISSAGGSLAEVVNGGGIVLQDFDSARWSDTLSRLLTNTAECHTLSQQGFAHASRFDWRETARQTFNVYRQVCP